MHAVKTRHFLQLVLLSALWGASFLFIRVASPVLADYRNVPFTKALTELVLAHKPEILLLGATTLGRDLAGKIQQQDQRRHPPPLAGHVQPAPARAAHGTRGFG